MDNKVSSLKMDLYLLPTSASHVTQGLKIAKGSFKWNEVHQGRVSNAGSDVKSRSVMTLDKIQAGTRRVGDISFMVSEGQDVENKTVTRRFELRDISVAFPEGRLSVITGAYYVSCTRAVSKLLR